MASLVVPATLLTIARSSLRIAFTKLLFPTFGLPIIENLIFVLSSSSYILGKLLVTISSKSLIPSPCSPLTFM